MNREALTFNLNQMQQEIETLIKECEAGNHDEDGPYVLGQSFAVIQNYLCNAWHHRLLDQGQLQRLSQEELDRYSTLIPNFCYRFQFDESFEK